MHLQVNAFDLDGNAQESVRLMSVPDECPRCHRKIHPKFHFASRVLDRALVQVVYRCTSQSCQELFLANYIRTEETVNNAIACALNLVMPVNPQNASFPEPIETLSPTFVSVFNQAIHAESQGLDQLVGIGFRKGLEFLIKDYAASKNKGNPEKIKEIRQTQLGPCIDTFIEDTNIKQCAKRAAWLGNDETHVVRKWESKDIGDLKTLVRLTVNWIENEHLTRRYIEEMQPPAKI
jgi:hypothetical protein